MLMHNYSPVYNLTPKIANLVINITKDLERINIIREQVLAPHLRRENRIKTIRSSLYIEANSLSLEQVADVIDGKSVVGPLHDIQEVKNAIEAYDHLLECDPYIVDDLLHQHGLITKDTVIESGKFRAGGVGVFSGSVAIHLAPPASQVPILVDQLLEWAKSTDLPQLIKSCIFHYEFEFIHPFSDGNGRMGRMWQTLLLYQENPVFGWLPVESIIAEHQAQYYEAIRLSTLKNDSAIFAEFMLETIAEGVAEFKANHGVVGRPIGLPFSKVEEAILKLIMDDDSLTYIDISKKINKSSKTVQRTVSSLKNRGLIRRSGSDKKGVWEVI
jgi:Fic family protein